jgi:hypothetical protein
LQEKLRGQRSEEEEYRQDLQDEHDLKKTISSKIIEDV